MTTIYTGLDIAKLNLQLHLAGRIHDLPNTAAGHRRLLKLLVSQAGAHVVCEATGGYERDVVAALHAAKVPVSVLNPAANQFGQLLFLFGAGGGGFGLQGLAAGGEDGGINVIGLGPLTGGPREVPDAGRIQNADGNVGSMKCGDEVAFVTTGGFTDDVGADVSRQEFKQPAVADGRVGQVVEATGEVKLQVQLGNIQARVDSGHNVLALSGKCELTLVGRSINGSSLGHRHEPVSYTHLTLPTNREV